MLQYLLAIKSEKTSFCVNIMLHHGACESSAYWLFVCFRTLNHQYDYTFDWTMLKQKAAQQGASSGGQGQQAQTPTGKQTDKPKPNMKG